MHKELLRYERFPFGVACAPSKFQKIIEMLLSGIEGVACFLNDILVCGRYEEKNVKRLEIVLSRLQEAELNVSMDGMSVESRGIFRIRNR